MPSRVLLFILTSGLSITPVHASSIAVFRFGGTATRVDDSPLINGGVVVGSPFRATVYWDEATPPFPTATGSVHYHQDPTIPIEMRVGDFTFEKDPADTVTVTISNDNTVGNLGSDGILITVQGQSPQLPPFANMFLRVAVDDLSGEVFDDHSLPTDLEFSDFDHGFFTLGGETFAGDRFSVGGVIDSVTRVPEPNCPTALLTLAAVAAAVVGSRRAVRSKIRREAV